MLNGCDSTINDIGTLHYIVVNSKLRWKYNEIIRYQNVKLTCHKKSYKTLILSAIPAARSGQVGKVLLCPPYGAKQGGHIYTILPIFYQF